MNWEGTSGINTYPVVFGSNKTWYSLATKNYEYTLNQNIIPIPTYIVESFIASVALYCLGIL